VGAAVPVLVADDAIEMDRAALHSLTVRPRGLHFASIAKGSRVSESIDNPVTSEHIRFLKRSADTDGELLAFELTIGPHGFVAAPHIHSAQEERFRVESGTVRFRVGSRESSATTGESLVVPPGTPHAWWNASDEPARVLVEFRPALDTESFFRQFFGLARDGKVNSRGLPRPLQLAVTALAFQREVRLARPPLLIQRVLFTPLALLGRLRGLRHHYERYERS